MNIMLSLTYEDFINGNVELTLIKIKARIDELKKKIEVNEHEYKELLEYEQLTKTYDYHTKEEVRLEENKKTEEKIKELQNMMNDFFIDKTTVEKDEETL